MTTPVTGDIKDFRAVKKEGVTLHNMPIVAEDSLKDAKHVINDHLVSGKRVGSIVTIVKGGKPIMYQAAGSKPTDLWVGVSVGATDITPA